MKRIASGVAMLFAVVALFLVAGDGPPRGWRATINSWRPEIEYVNRRADLSVDVNAVYTDLKFVRAPTYLTLVTTPLEDERCLHPDVVYVPQGFGGYNWWMVCTPFPATNSGLYELPEIFYSADGDSWTAIAGNPIDAYPGTTDESFDSDPCLFYQSNNRGTPTLYCFYRWSDASPAEDRIYVRTSTDGTTWSDETVVITGATRSSLASPIVRNIRGTYYMWCVDVSATPDKLVYRTSSSPTTGWSAASDCTINGTGSDVVWHANVQQWGDMLAFIGTFKSSYNFYFGTSLDGITFNCQELYATPATASAWDSDASYQGSMVWNPHERTADIFYGGQDGTDYYIGRGKLFLLPSKAYDLTPLNAMLSILGDCRGFWPFFDGSGDGGEEASETQDYSLYGHDLVPSKDIGTWDTAPVLRAPVHVLTFDGTDEEMDHADDADFTFISGGNDIAMSCGAWIYVGNIGACTIMGKHDTTTDQEWRFWMGSDETVGFWAFDESVANVYEGIDTDAALSQNVWHFVVYTCDATQGEDKSDGMAIYVDGLAVATSESSDAAVGTYVDMEDLTAPFQLGHTKSSGSASSFFPGKMAMPFVTAKELSAVEVWILYLNGKAILGLFIFSPAVFASRWRRRKSLRDLVADGWRVAA